MLAVKILAVGRRMPTWVNEGIVDYKKRIQGIDLEILEIPQIKRSASLPVSKAMEQECTKLLAAIETDSYIIALDQLGQRINSRQLANNLNHWMQDHQSVTFLIGGSDGLSLHCKKSSHAVWSLSDMTLPHALARLLLVEQVYRAWTILKRHPYHHG